MRLLGWPTILHHVCCWWSMSYTFCRFSSKVESNESRFIVAYNVCSLVSSYCRTDLKKLQTHLLSISYSMNSRVWVIYWKWFNWPVCRETNTSESRHNRKLCSFDTWNYFERKIMIIIMPKWMKKEIFFKWSSAMNEDFGDVFGQFEIICGPSASFWMAFST